MVRLLRLFKSKPKESYYPIRLNDMKMNKKQGFPNNIVKTSKYSILSFLPKFLFTQFTMVTNIYFLAILIICCIPSISTVTPITSIIPLVFVLVVAGIKEIYEDVRRHLADRKFNQTNYIYCTSNNEVSIQSRRIKTGMIIKLKQSDIVPADCIPLLSSNQDGITFIETAALDGETNLKQVLVPNYFIGKTINDINELKGTLLCEYPQPKFDQFRGSITIGNDKISINEKNLLMQGTIIRNTNFVYVLICYCGIHTKLSLNQTPPKLKKSNIDTKFNIFVFVMIIIQCVICLILAILSGHSHSIINDPNEGFWYLPKDDINNKFYGLKKFFGYFTLISYIIPISCQVSLELAKFAQGIFFEQDDDMKIKQINSNGKEEIVGMNAKSTGLNDELGMVKFVLSDKTGTLTENEMKFKKCAIKERVYDISKLQEILNISNNKIKKNKEINENTNNFNNNNSKEINHSCSFIINSNEQENQEESNKNDIINFLKCMALCNTVNINDEKFSSQSPDEEALCLAAKNCGIELISRNQKSIELLEFGINKKYNILSTFEFNSDRKRMSVLTRDENGIITLWCKGADNVMNERCNEEGKECMKYLNEFSSVGLRTLVLAIKTINEDIFSKWYEKYDDAINLLEGREEEVELLQNEMEKDLQIIGISAIEDKLQEGVPETIEMLLRGGIKVWMITGDKMETAINIGKSCKLINNTYYCINDDTLNQCKTTLNEIKLKINQQQHNFSLIINGKNTDWCVHELKNIFKDIVLLSSSVICCRVTPKQKAEITNCVKKITNKIVLTIGDGANDVPMINTGNVGVGIYGKEGNQAARASDFAIRKFRHLAKLILYHGRTSLLRNSEIIKICFYKNASFFLILLWYSFISNFTCQVVFDDYIMTFFNILFTQIQPILIGIFDRDLQWQTIQLFPEVNKEIHKSLRGKVINFILWFFYGIYQSLIFFFVFFWFISPSDITGKDGLNGGIIYTSLTITFYSLFTIIVTLIIETKTWNWILVIGHIISIIFIFIIYGLTCYIPGYSTYDISWNGFTYVFQSFNFYLITIFTIIISVAPLILKRFIQRYFFPDMYHVVQEIQTSLETNYGKKRNFFFEGSNELKQLINHRLPLISKDISFNSTSSNSQINEIELVEEN
ncbi:phospholipid-translocating P-type ATPase [Entamoeba histolytica HM-3:IMSS]|nr:phospholipid translocating P-type ATPase, putative [Entamoeba histolytica KU27]EMS13488.1 phospholipid-translocating P-type ATPase [Entamoeba histolytica HM-3:IMSS]